MIKFYNTLTKKKEIFKPINKDNVVRVYSCGPTVYNYAQIGNLRAAIFPDILKRFLRYSGFKVEDVINITDVGHLVSDEDDGEDKMLKAAKRENKDPYEIARHYENVYIQNLKDLNVILPKTMPRATEHIKEQVDIINELDKKGFVYSTSDGLYFDVSKFKDYGKLSGQSLSDKKAGARVEVDSDKKSPFDFALWKFLTGDNKNHIMKWESPWGVGFPGWHIECSAMGHKYLGDKIDIHTGGIDHIPVHHENEIAQNECSGCIKKVNFWMHNAFLLVDNEKMSKSLGNVYILSDLIDKGYNALVLRAMYLGTHYRKQMNFTFESLDASSKVVKTFNDFNDYISHLKSSSKSSADVSKIVKKYEGEFVLSLSDDLNTPKALASINDFMNEVNKLDEISSNDLKLVVDFFGRVDGVFGLLEVKGDVSKDVLDLVNLRIKARENKNWPESDRLRDEIFKLGYNIKDSKDAKDGYILSKI